MNFIIINLGWDHSVDEIKWADKLLKAHKNHRAIIVSHYILTNTVEKHFSPQGKKIYDNFFIEENKPLRIAFSVFIS